MPCAFWDPDGPKNYNLTGPSRYKADFNPRCPCPIRSATSYGNHILILAPMDMEMLCEESVPTGGLTGLTPRRRMQNRIAQRRFREKARARKQGTSETQSQSTRESSSATSPEGPDGSLSSSSSLQNNSHAAIMSSTDGGAASPATSWDQSILFQDLESKSFPNPSVHLWQSPAYLAGSSGDPNTCPSQFLPGGTQLQVPPGWPEFSGSDAGISDFELPRTDAGAQHIFELPGLGSRHPSLSRPRSTCELISDTKTNEQDMKKALATIQNQKTYLCREGEQLIEQVIEIYKLGVCLELIPGDSNLHQVLLAAKGQFLSSFRPCDMR